MRFFVRWHGRHGEMRHPRDMGAAEVEAFLNMLANERKVSAFTHNQPLSALLFLYREVLGIDLPWLDGVNRPAQKRRIPSVLTKEEVSTLFQFLDNDMRVLAQLLYGTGMRLMEGLRLHIKDVDFDRHVIIVREANPSVVPLLDGLQMGGAWVRFYDAARGMRGAKCPTGVSKNA